MRALFNLGIIMIALYLFIDAVIVSEDGADRPVVQLVAGMGILPMLIYCVANGTKGLRITRYWSFSVFWIAFTAMMAFYYLLSLADFPSDYASKSPRNLFVATYILVTVFFIYYGVVLGHLTDKKLVVLIAVLMMCALVDLYRALSNPLERMGNEVINTSSGYVFVMLLPLLLYRYRSQSLWVFLALLGLTAITGKRGALVIFVMLSIYYLFNARTFWKSLRYNYKTGIYALAAGLVFIYFAYSAYESLLFRIETIVHPKTGSIGSGRDVIWRTLIDYWVSSGAAQILLGSGYFSTIQIEGHLAHNDYIQFLVDYGLVGLSVFLFIQFQFYRGTKTVRGVDAYVHRMLVACLIIFVGRGLFAGTVRTDQIYWSISAGYLLGVATLLRINYARKD